MAVDAERDASNKLATAPRVKARTQHAYPSDLARDVTTTTGLTLHLRVTPKAGIDRIEGVEQRDGDSTARDEQLVALLEDLHARGERLRGRHGCRRDQDPARHQGSHPTMLRAARWCGRPGASRTRAQPVTKLRSQLPQIRAVGAVVVELSIGEATAASEATVDR